MAFLPNNQEFQAAVGQHHPVPGKVPTCPRLSADGHAVIRSPATIAAVPYLDGPGPQQPGVQIPGRSSRTLDRSGDRVTWNIVDGIDAIAILFVITTAPGSVIRQRGIDPPIAAV